MQHNKKIVSIFISLETFLIVILLVGIFIMTQSLLGLVRLEKAAMQPPESPSDLRIENEVLPTGSLLTPEEKMQRLLEVASQSTTTSDRADRERNFNAITQPTPISEAEETDIQETDSAASEQYRLDTLSSLNNEVMVEEN